MASSVSIDQAAEGDAAAILKVMLPWNMHHVPSPEMEELNTERFFIARVDGKVVGAAGYEILSQELGKTTLLGVLPKFNRMGIGTQLQHTRCAAMYRLGVKRVITNADLPKTIAWYQKRFGYKVVGKLKKVASFGSPDIDHWTTLEMDLEAYMRAYNRDERDARRFVGLDES